MIRDISNKINTLRTAKAQALVFCNQSSVEMIKEKKIPKGDVFEFARAAGFLGAKNTSNLIPHCHPIGIDSFKIDFEYLDEKNFKQYTTLDQFKPGIVILTEAKYIGRTGNEIEAITGASIAALTLFDMLKPFDDDLEIGSVRVIEKTGGKSGAKYFKTSPTCAVLVCSDSTFKGTREDSSGKIIKKMLQEQKAKVVAYTILPDEIDLIQKQIISWVDKDIQFIFTSGGTGLSPKDKTIEAVEEILEREAAGITEAMRSHGQIRTPLAMMSRSIAGTIKKTTIITLPGSSNGAKESLEAILPAVFHARKMLESGGH